MGEHFEPVSEPKQIEQREKPLQLEMAVFTVSSAEHEERNEDASFTNRETGRFGVFDGMGGAPAGDLASRAAMMQLTKSAMDDAIKHADSPQALQEAIEVANTFLADSAHPLTEFAVKKTGRILLRRMAKAIERITETTDPTVREAFVRYANAKYKKKLGRDLNPEDPADLEIIRHALVGVGTTASFGKIWNNAEGKRFVTTFQLGDSSIYRLRNGALEKLTVDDSFLTSLQKAGLIPSEAEYERQTASAPNNPDYSELRISIEAILGMAPPDYSLIGLVNTLKDKQSDISIEDIRHYVTASMNNEQKGALMARMTTSEVMSGDILITMTDGVTDNLTLSEIQSLAERKKNDPEQLAELLTAYAGRRSRDENHPRAKPDDMTAVVVVIP